MTRSMTLATAALFAAGVFSPTLAAACSFGKTASHGTQTMAEVKTPEVTEDAITTFDPTQKPIFEEAAEAKEDIAEDAVASE